MYLLPPAIVFYTDTMTRLLAEALEAVKRLPPESQDKIARAMLRLAQRGGEPEEILPEHLSAVLEGLAQAKAGQFASDEEVEAASRRFES